MKILSIILIVILTMINPITITAQDSANGLKISGFGFWVQEIPKNGKSLLQLKHAWLIGEKTLSDDLEIKAFLAFQGPPKIIHTLALKWKKPFAGINYLRAGRFEPPFGHGTNYYRIDRNPTIYYSAIDQPVVARSNGIEIAGTIDSLEWKLGAFSGERLLGNINISDDGKWDIYPLFRYTFSNLLSCGLSQRFGPVYAGGVNAVSQINPLSLQLEVEAITSKDTINYSILSIYQPLSWLKVVARYENIKSENQLTPGFIIYLPHDWEIKGNAVVDKNGLKIVLGQFILRW
ncbi:MAG: hypothetical protein V1712_03405 [Patescibacteria group bacterium]